MSKNLSALRDKKGNANSLKTKTQTKMGHMMINIAVEATLKAKRVTEKVKGATKTKLKQSNRDSMLIKK